VRQNVGITSSLETAINSALIIVAQEEEHRRITRLHDRNRSGADALITNLATVQTLPAAKPKQQLAEIRGRRGNAQRSIRSCWICVPHSWMTMDFAALSWCANKRLGSMFASNDSRRPELRLPSTVETTLFRIGQKLIASIAKHAKARNVRMSLDTPLIAARSTQRNR
jgi:hypothetical protein